MTQDLASTRSSATPFEVDPHGEVGELVSNSRTLPSSWYTSQEIFDLEMRHVFRRSWELVGHGSQVARPGDYFTAEVGGVPLVIARDRDGALQGHVNICRHRHHPVASGEGRATLFQCHYHQWTYKLDGSFHSAPRARNDPQFDGSALCLTKVQVEMWGDGVYANPSGDAPSLAEVYGAAREAALGRGLPIAEATFQGSRTMTADANWKLLWDNNCECYHCDTIHSSWAAQARLGPEYYRDRLIGPFHYETEMDQHEHSDPDFAYYVWPAAFFMSGPGIVPETPVTSGDGFTGYSTMRFVPIRPDHTEMVVSVFHRGDLSATEIEQWLDGIFGIIEEDREPCELLQRAHRSGVAEPGTLVPSIDTEQHTLLWERLLHRTLTEPQLPLYQPLS